MADIYAAFASPGNCCTFFGNSSMAVVNDKCCFSKKESLTLSVKAYLKTCANGCIVHTTVCAVVVRFKAPLFVKVFQYF
jgi:hypothetical protein